MNSTSHTPWHERILNELQELINPFALSGEATKALRDFVYKTAREQYLRGNKCGIRWAYAQQEKQA